MRVAAWVCESFRFGVSCFDPKLETKPPLAGARSHQRPSETPFPVAIERRFGTLPRPPDGAPTFPCISFGPFAKTIYRD